MRQFYVYVMTNARNTVLYTGVTNNLLRRVAQHRIRRVASFTRRYQVGKLVYYEVFQDAYRAICREKQLKAGSRKRKEKLIAAMNPEWLDLTPSI